MKSKSAKALKSAVLPFLLSCSFATSAQCEGPHIPRELKFASVDEYRQSDALAVDCMVWLLSMEALPCTEKRQELDAFVMLWLSGHPDLVLEVEPDFLPFLEAFPELLFPSIYAMALERMESPQLEGIELHALAVERMLDLYGKTKPYRKSAEFKHLRKARRKGRLQEELGT